MSEAKNLLIVESPAKAKTINKFLGKDFVVKASMGHIRDIPHKAEGTKFGIDLENNYQPVYEPLESRRKILAELKAQVKKAGDVYLAPDPDREGEAIAWHLQEALHLNPARTHRVTFNAITKNTVQNAIKNHGKINMDLVNAQQGRRVLDRLIGFSLSPFLIKAIAKGLSAGRVQSVAVRLVVEREREIIAFKPEEYWKIIADLFTPNAKGNAESKFSAQLVKWKDEKFALGNPVAQGEASVKKIVAALQGADWKITAIDKREVKTRPGAPFITSTLQQAASTALYFGAKKTMMLAQRLYEGVEVDGTPTGLITYMRTDSTRIAPEALNDARQYIGDNFSREYLPEKPNFFAGKQGAQDAHEAVRPTNVFLTPEQLAHSVKDRDLLRLYDLIWRRFVTSQMAAKISETTTATIAAGDGTFEAKGSVIIFDGFTIIEKARREQAKNSGDNSAENSVAENEKSSDDANSSSATDDDKIENALANQTLPRLAVGDDLKCEKISPSQHFTSPPPRYSEASLVRALEKEGIGRPSTYATIVQTIQDRGYTQVRQRRFHATELGMAVNDFLIDNFPEVMELKFTAEVENNLDDVESGKRDWYKVVDEFYRPIEKKIAKGKADFKPLRDRPAPNGEKCPKCGEDMRIRYSASGAFLGCKKYPECRGTISLPGEIQNNETENGENAPTIACPSCGAPMQKRRGRFGEFMSCSRNPECKQVLTIGKDGKIPSVPVGVNWDRKCAKCGGVNVIKVGKLALTVACTNPDCGAKTILDLHGKVVDVPDVSDEKCQECGAPMTIRMSRRGPFLGCSKFPKCRHARPLAGDAKTKTSSDASAAGDEAAVTKKRKPASPRKKAAAKKS